MPKETRCKGLETKFDIDIINDLIFGSDDQIYLVYDYSQKPTMCYRLSGNLSNIGLPQFDAIEARKLLAFIEPNNLLAEVEGKNNFVESIETRFHRFENELFLYIPIKTDEKTLWHYASYRRFEDKKIVLSYVLRIYENTPDDIIHYQKTYQDALTRLFTRETLKKHMNYLKDTKDSYFLYLDIDGFKLINDQYGHQMGDQFLIDLANHFISRWERNVIYYRLGGDEFAIYCSEHSYDDIVKRVQRLIYDIENLNDTVKTLKISTSVGIVKITDENKDYHQLLNLGDDAMYASKAKGRGKYTFHEKTT